MKITTILRNAMIGTLIAVVPVTYSIAATRPNTAVPMASSALTTSTAAQDDDGDGISWVWIAAVGVAAAVVLFLVLNNDDDDDDSVSDG